MRTGTLLIPEPSAVNYTPQAVHPSIACKFPVTAHTLNLLVPSFWFESVNQRQCLSHSGINLLYLYPAPLPALGPTMTRHETGDAERAVDVHLEGLAAVVAVVGDHASYRYNNNDIFPK